MSSSRTRKSAINSVVTLTLYLINIPLNFYGRKVFLDTFGNDVMGMQSVVGNFLSMLSLAELGVLSAVQYALYKPIINRDRKTINELVSVQGWFYRWVVAVISIASLIILLRFPSVFSDLSEKAPPIPLWYPYLVFFVYIFPVYLSYWINYRMIVLGADQQLYKYTSITQIAMYAKTILSILYFLYAPGDRDTKLLFWAGIEMLFAIISTLILERIISRTYPWLKPNVSYGRFYVKKHAIVLRKTLQVFFHKLGIIIGNSFQSLIIYRYVSLAMVNLYNNYGLIPLVLSRLQRALFDSITAGVGTLIAEGDKERVYKFFWEYLSIRIFLATVASFGIIVWGDAFVALWLGKESLILNPYTIWIIAILFWIGMTRVGAQFIDGYGMFADIWAPLVEGGIALGSSLVLGKFWGLNGVIMGTVLSNLLIGILWKFYYLFTQGLQKPIAPVYLNYMKYVLLSWVSIAIGVYFINEAKVARSSLSDFMTSVAIYAPLFFLLELGVFALFSRGFRQFMERMLHFVKNKGK